MSTYTAPAPCDTLIDEIEKVKTFITFSYSEYKQTNMQLREMYRCVYDIQLRRKQLRENGGNNAANIALKARIAKKNANDGNTNKKIQIEDVEDVEMKNGNKDNGKNDAIAADHNKEEVIDEDVAMAMALSMSMKEANIKTPAIEKKANKQSNRKSTAKKSKRVGSKKKSTRKPSKKSAKKNSKKRKKMEDGDEEYVPSPAKKRVKTK